MQTPKARTSPSSALQKSSPRSLTSEAPQKNSSPQSSEVPQKVSPRVARQLKTGPRFLDPTASSANQASKTPKERSPKVVDHKSPRSPASEKKRPSKVLELESQISRLENDLKIVKDQLCSTEAQKKQAQKDAEESNQQLLSLSLKLEELQKQFHEPKASNGVISDDHDSAALASAFDEIKRLKIQLELAQSKESGSDRNELDNLKGSLSEALSMVEDMKQQLMNSKESEARAQALVGETLGQLETAKKTVETLRSDGLKTAEAYNAIASELEQSRARVNFLEDLVAKLKANGEGAEIEATEASSLKREVEQLRSTLEAAEIRYNEEQRRSVEQIRNAAETVEKIKLESSRKEAELEDEIRRSKYEIEELKANLMDKETELQGICEENESLALKLESSDNPRAGLTSREPEAADVEPAAEGEEAMKVEHMEEIERSNRKAARAARAAEQLEAAQAASAEMEAELRRLKVQSDQWRKAAEAAAAMLSAAGNNGKVMERTGSMDSVYSPRTGTSSPYGDEVDEEELMKKKNANMLRRLGVLWKKPQKQNV